MVYFSTQDKDVAQSIYHDLTDAVAAAVARREATVATIAIAAYQHRFGVDLTAHATPDLARARLREIAVRECARNPELRERVIDRFGAWPAQSLHDSEITDMIDAWPELTAGESLWIAECDVQSASADEPGCACPRSVMQPLPPHDERFATEEEAAHARGAATRASADDPSSCGRDPRGSSSPAPT